MTCCTDCISVDLFHVTTLKYKYQALKLLSM